MINPVTIQSLQSTIKPDQVSNKVSGTELAEQFNQFLDDAITNMNVQKVDSGKLTTQFINGETIDIPQMLLAAEKVSLGLELTVEVRNKAIEAYQEIMRMQM